MCNVAMCATFCMVQGGCLLYLHGYPFFRYSTFSFLVGETQVVSPVSAVDASLLRKAQGGGPVPTREIGAVLPDEDGLLALC